MAERFPLITLLGSATNEIIADRIAGFIIMQWHQNMTGFNKICGLHYHVVALDRDGLQYSFLMCAGVVVPPC